MQIQAYLDNVFDVGGLLEDAETKNAALEKVEELEEHLSHVSAPPCLDHQRCSAREIVVERLARLFPTWQLEICSVCFSQVVGDNNRVECWETLSAEQYYYCCRRAVLLCVAHGAAQKGLLHMERS